MSPVIENSIVAVAPGKWLIGSSMICESGFTEPPHDSQASWIGPDGSNFYLSECNDTLALLPSKEEVDELSRTNRVYKAGTGAAAWAFGGVHIKAKSWIPGLQSEHDTMAYVRNLDSKIPMPDVLFSWVDVALSRSFLVLKTVEGKTLYEAWSGMSPGQRQKLADTVASHCADLAQFQSERFETCSRKGVREDYLTKGPALDIPSWKPNLAGPFVLKELQSYLHASDIAIGDSFYFYHADLGPTNIIVDEHNDLAAIIDWESAAFYPQFWIATKPLVSAGFNLGCEDRSEWAFMLSQSLGRKKFNADVETFRTWRIATKK
jgi:serine/threonine protein kinase